jgi:Flp pilus assembly pilin Flp
VKTKLITLFRVFRKSELGQDLAEYCLITALIALVACGILYKVSGGMQGIWTTANTTLAANPQPAGSPASGSGNAPASTADAPAK